MDVTGYLSPEPIIDMVDTDHHTASDALRMLEAGESSRVRMEIEAKRIRKKDTIAAVARDPFALFLNRKVTRILIDLDARSSLKMRKTRTNLPHRRLLIVGMLEIRSIHPHFRK